MNHGGIDTTFLAIEAQDPGNFDMLKNTSFIGIISLIVLAVAIYALYGRQLAGVWRRVYALMAMIAFYLNVFVLIAQLFAKVPALKALAPTQTEAPFKETQLAALIAFVVLTILAAIKFHPEPVAPAT